MAAVEGKIIQLDGLENLDTEVLEAYQYLAYKEKGLSNAQIAAEMGWSEAKLYRRKAEWKTNTILMQAKQIVMGPKLEAIDDEIRQTIEEYPQLIRRLRQIAMGFVMGADGKKMIDVSPHVSLEAFEILSQRVIDPALASLSESDDGKKNYADAVIENGLSDPITSPMKGLLAKVPKA